MPAQSTMVPAAAGSEARWNFLDDTYWIVPTPYLPAVILVNTGTPMLVPAVDQTVWHITAVVAGYVFGEVQTNVGNGWVHSTLVGSITPTGQASNTPWLGAPARLARTRDQRTPLPAPLTVPYRRSL